MWYVPRPRSAASSFYGSARRKMSQGDQPSEGLVAKKLSIGAERCCNQRPLPLAAMLDLGTAGGVSYPLGVAPPLGRAAVPAFMTSYPRGVGLDECPT